MKLSLNAVGVQNLQLPLLQFQLQHLHLPYPPPVRQQLQLKHLQQPLHLLPQLRQQLLLGQLQLHCAQGDMT